VRAEHLRPNLIPVLQYPDGTFRGETTALAYDLEARHAERSVIPEDQAIAFVCDLVEDLADEWAVKPLFLYRWWDPQDQAYVSRWAGEEWSTSEATTGSAEEIEEFRRRQIARMPILGATEENQAVVGGELPADAGGFRAACRHDALSVRKPAIARRLRLVRPA
jgi:glutathione S-transferase